MAGKTLENFLLDTFSALQQYPPLHKTIKEGSFGRVYVFRCSRFEKLIDILEDRIYLASLDSQHLVLKIALASEIFGSSAVEFEVKLPSGPRVDFQYGDRTYEVKTMNNVPWQHIDPLLTTYWKVICHHRSEKHRWWLTFLNQRADPKGKKGSVSVYYIGVIEVNAQSPSVKVKEKKKIIREAQVLMNEAMESVAEEDSIDDPGFLVPVKNVLIVEKLRKDKAQLIAERDALKAERDALKAEINALKDKIEKKP